ncbi:MAG TPA: NAD(P)/FAD-dependent oxidoreductase [Candidatus Eisenbacteria bacterium]|jgi:thioredoxin reductase (NADPH)
MAVAVLIAGAGPAGVSAALWARSLGLEPLLLEAGPVAGGQLHLIHFHPADLAAVEAGDGPVIAAAMARQLEAARIALRCDAAAAALEPARDAASRPAVRLAGGERIEAEAVLIATGVRRRRLEIPGERELEGRGVSYSATRDRAMFAGEPVVVAGGGDAAFENALLLAAVGCKVTLAVRGAPRARAEFRARAAAEPLIEVRERTRITAAVGEARLRAVRLSGPAGEEEREAAGLVIKVGVIPNTEWCRDTLAHDADGFLAVDAGFAASQPRVWAAGDVTRPRLPAIAVAIGHGALAAAAIRRALAG